MIIQDLKSNLNTIIHGVRTSGLLTRLGMDLPAICATAYVWQWLYQLQSLAADQLPEGIHSMVRQLRTMIFVWRWGPKPVSEELLVAFDNVLKDLDTLSALYEHQQS